MIRFPGVFSACLIAIVLWGQQGYSAGQRTEKKVPVDPPEGSALRPFYLSADFGLPISHHSLLMKQAKQTYDLDSQPAQGSMMGSVRAGWQKANQHFRFGLGTGLLYETLVLEGGDYSSGSMSLDLTALNLLVFAKLGYEFASAWTVSVSLSNYMPLEETVTVDAPTGQFKDQRDSQFEMAVHVTELMLHYAMNNQYAVFASLYLPSISYKSVEGRGMDGLTGGVQYAL